jgi:SulP family sulfate permease
MFLTRLVTSLKDFIPMSLVCWREGYSRETFFHDLFAGVTVGVIALPLAMAFAIGSGVAPEKGLFTAIVAGFLISLLGGSRVQIGGPTGAFVVIVYGVIQKHGYDGLAIATLLAGAMMIFMGIARFGIFLKFIPYPVTTGFTAGIALSIFSSQIKDFFGLSVDQLPTDFIGKWCLYIQNAHTAHLWASAVAITTLGIIFFLRYKYPKIPGTIIAVVFATLFVTAFHLPVDTIQTKFGGIPSALPHACLPSFSFAKVQAVFPDAITIALLGAIESLLSAMVADGMTGHRHRSNCELVAQGLANIGSILYGGIPATGAIARSSANIKMGAKTPLAGMVHAITLLLLMALFSTVAAKVPLPALAAVLIFVAWNMSEVEHFVDLLRGQASDICVLLITFFLTVFIDLTVAVPVGVMLACGLFLKKMSDSTTVDVCQILLSENANEHPTTHDSEIIFRKDVPEEIAVFEINGPFFFAVADILNEHLRRMSQNPKIFILRMRKVPIVDATGARALIEFHKKCRERGIVFILSGVRESLAALLKMTGVEEVIGSDRIFPHFDHALSYARPLLKSLLASTEKSERLTPTALQP